MKIKFDDFISQNFSKLDKGLSKLLLGLSHYKTDRDGKKDLEHFRNEVFYKLAILFITIGIFPICYGAYLFFQENKIIIGILEILTYIVILILIRSNRIAVLNKRNILVLCVYFLGLMLLFVAGPMGAGLLVIYSTFGLASCILNKKQNIIFIFINLLVFTGISVFLHLELLNNLAINRYRETWYIVAISAQSMGTLFFLIINNLFSNTEKQIQEIGKSEEETKRLLERTLSMFNNHEVTMLLIEPLSGEIIESNPAASTFYGYSKEELLNMKFQDINTLDKDELSALRLKVLGKGREYFTFPHRLKNGEVRVVDVYNTPIEYGGKKVLFSIIFDVTEREKATKQNEFLAYHDYLTGVHNRRYFDEEFERRVRSGDFPIAILLGNIDGFKTFNDAFGHVKGDEVLKVIANRLEVVIIDGSVVARVGGDEFAILVSGENEAEIRQYLNKLTQEFDKEIEDSGKEAMITLSWGYGIQRDEMDTLDNLYGQAEAFMNNRKFYSQNSLRSKTVNVIMETLFTKSEREKNHSERVGKLCETIARKMNLSKPDVDKIRVAGFLHDIGKIGIEEVVLNKAGKLDAKEWEVMKLHPAKGASILVKTNEYNDLAEIVLSHHERYDGKGYPNGLAGEKIPLMARIIAVSDAYDAMTEQRTYRATFTEEEAVAELIKCSGAQFDPEIVSVFINMIMGMEKTD